MFADPFGSIIKRSLYHLNLCISQVYVDDIIIQTQCQEYI